jgi:hypothetical protein
LLMIQLSENHTARVQTGYIGYKIVRPRDPIPYSDGTYFGTYFVPILGTYFG